MKSPTERLFSVRTRGVARSFTAPFLTATLTVSIVFFGLVPGWIDLETVQRKLSERANIATTLERKAVQLDSVDEGELEQQVRDATLAVPIVIPYQQVLNQIASSTTKYALGVKEMVLTSEQGKDGTALGVHLSVVGTRDGVSGFVGSLYRSVPLATLENLELSRALVGNVNDAQYSAKLAMKFHHAALPRSIGKPSEALPKMTDEMQRVLESLRTYEVVSIAPLEEAGSFVPLDRLFATEDVGE